VWSEGEKFAKYQSENLHFCDLKPGEIPAQMTSQREKKEN